MVYVTPAGGLARSYVISEAEGLVVVDIGSIGTAEDVAIFIKRLPGRSLHDVKCIVATHFHIDHIGGIGRLLKKCLPDTVVLFHFLVDHYLKKQRTISRLKNWRTGFLPAALFSTRYVRKFAHFRFESLAGIPLPILEKSLNLPYHQDGIRFINTEPSVPCKLNFGGWEILATPGHTEDSLSLYNATSGELICGDVILNFKKNGTGYLNLFCWNREAVENSYQNLIQKVDAKTIYPGHGEIINNGSNVLLKVRTFH
jgi:glyoxylase-like metal-dependent hydrolase (beta-lactamase superfamily II)